MFKSIVCRERLMMPIFYILVYTIMTMYYYFNGKVYGDARGVDLEQPEVLLFSYLSVVTATIVFFFLVSLIIRLIRVPVVSNRKYNVIHYIIFVMNVSYSIFSYKYNVGMSGVEIDQSVPKVLLYIFILIQPVFLSYIYIAYFIESKDKIYYINIIIFFISVLLKGWLGVIIYLVILLFVKNKDYIMNNFLKFFISVVAFFIFAPLLKLFKDVIMAFHQFDSNDIIETARGYLEKRDLLNILDVFNVYFFKLLGRIEHVSISYYVNVVDLGFYNSIKQVYAEGWINERFYTAFTGANDEYVQKLLANQIYPYYSWQVQVPIPVRLSLGIENVFVYLAYLSIVTLLWVLLFKIISNNEAMKSLNTFALFALLYHGWNYSVVLWVQSLIVFCIMLVVLRIFYSTFSKAKLNSI
ncbi:oligosaccharide repeat unit polymerase [Vibrio campbellii]|uniref:Oligosaccharide repeat unit polymerase n=2 Tax=Vibrio campbellii TaxID=680 RepID=A0ABY5ICQ6_9VIBR|nr:oligosaccharide repeat unit polymerase [Vibrio campbellii]UTZ32073.1 oligosaccharide repeat unit polymerase [Vibrio campbellii]